MTFPKRSYAAMQCSSHLFVWSFAVDGANVLVGRAPPNVLVIVGKHNLSLIHKQVAMSNRKR